MDFLDLSSYEAAEDAVEGAHQPPHFAPATTSSMQDQSNGPFFNPTVQPGISCDVKPRLTKEQHDILESHYQKQPKPNTNIKKGFAETLNVSLEKVNNWFQNRRAKTKQDAKKVANAVSIYQPGQQNLNSDSEASPFQVSPQYAAMMQQWSTDGPATNGLGISHIQQQQGLNQIQGQALQNGSPSSDQLGNFAWPSQMLQIPYHPDYDLDSNRRTLTQENFDAMSRNGGMMDNYGQFGAFQNGFSGDQDVWNQVFPNTSDLKQQDLSFPYPIGAPLSSNDSTVPSTISADSLQFPTTNAMQSRANVSAPNSEWADSRSSSLSALQQDGTIPLMSAPPSQPPVTPSAQWQPGQSVPVDVDKLREGFRQAAQSRPSADSSRYEQPLAFPSDEAFTRRNSQASALAHSMGNIGIGTPQSGQSSVFKSPAPPTNIAARRQRPRPAALGMASLRSQSYGGAVQPGSPAYPQQQNHLTQDQQLRRIRSAVVMNGGVSQGRVMKSTPGSAQRSPLNWSFSDALNSPGLVRHVSQGNLAPPTPQSPSEFPRPDQAQFSAWQRSGQVGRQPSISEAELDHSGLSYEEPVPVPPQNFSSPPHTPMYYDHPFLRRVGSNVITENTPPQSAPAGQTCFPSNIFATSSQSVQQPQLSMQHQMQAPGLSQSHHFASALVPEQQVQMPNVTFAPNQQANVTTGPPPGIPLQFANGVPVVSAEGTVKMSFPPQVHLLQQQSQQMQTPPQVQYAFATSGAGSPNAQAMTQSTTQAKGELLVHEYSPPDAIKRAVTPRKPVDTGPKNYAFANTGPEHFEEKKGKKSDAKDSSASSSSPESSTGSASTS